MGQIGILKIDRHQAESMREDFLPLEIVDEGPMEATWDGKTFL